MVKVKNRICKKIEYATICFLKIFRTYQVNSNEVLNDANKIVENLESRQIAIYRELYFRSLLSLAEDFTGKNFSMIKNRKKLCVEIHKVGLLEQFCKSLFKDVEKMANLGKTSVPRMRRTIELAKILCDLTANERSAAYYHAKAIIEHIQRGK